MKKEIKELFNKIDDCLSDKVSIECLYEDDCGRHCGEIYTIDDCTCSILEKLIDKLYELLED